MAENEPGSSENAGSRIAAQRRADRITGFRAELAELEREGVLALSAEQRDRVLAHQDGLLRDLAARFDVDVSEGEKKLSLGMRVASFLGALAFAISVFLFFRRIWGLLSTPMQVAILVGAPLLGCLGTDLAARREKSGYFASLLALVTFACFLFNLTLLGDIFAITPSAGAFLAWGALGLVLAYAYGPRLLLAAGLAMTTIWAAAAVITWSGAAWTAVWERPEMFLPAGLLLAALPSFLPHRRRADFPPVFRICGFLMLLTATFALASWGEGSFLTVWEAKTIETFYQIAGLALSAGVVALGIRRSWPEGVNIGVTFFILFLWTRLYHWWWDWMPKYMFFLILGLTAAAALWGLQRLRGRAAEPAGGAA
jgi:hypothetical protein